MPYIFTALMLIFGTVAAENSGIPFAATPGIAIAVALLRRNVSYVTVFVTLFAGYFAGSILSYYIGSRSSYKNMLGYLPKARKEQFRNVIEDKLKRHPGLAIVSAKLIGQIRPFASYVFGYLHVPIKTFTFWTILGSLLVSLYDLFLAEIAFRLVQRYFDDYQALFYLAVVFILILPVIAVLWWQKKR